MTCLLPYLMGFLTGGLFCAFIKNGMNDETREVE